MVSKTLLRIQACFNSDVVWMVSVLSLIASFSSLRSVGTVPSAPTTNVSPFYWFFRSLARSSISLSFCFLLFLLYGPLQLQNLQDNNFLLIYSMSASKNFMGLIFSNRFLFVHLAFINVANFSFVSCTITSKLLFRVMLIIIPVFYHRYVTWS